MVSKRTAGSRNESLVVELADDPEPIRIVGIEHIDPLSLAHAHLVLFLGLKPVYHHELLDVLAVKVVDGGFVGGRAVAVAAGGGMADSGRVGVVGGSLDGREVARVKGIDAGLYGRAATDASATGVDGVGLGDLRSPRGLGRGVAWGEGELCRGNVRVVARHVGIVHSGDLWLTLVATVLLGGPDISEGYVARVAVLGHREDPVVVAVEDFHALSLAHGEFLVAARRVVAGGRHLQVGRALLGGSVEDLHLQGALPVGNVSAPGLLLLALVVRLVAGGVGTSTARAAAAMLAVALGTALDEGGILAGVPCLVWTTRRRASGTCAGGAMVGLLLGGVIREDGFERVRYDVLARGLWEGRLLVVTYNKSNGR